MHTVEAAWGQMSPKIRIAQGKADKLLPVGAVMPIARSLLRRAFRLPECAAARGFPKNHYNGESIAVPLGLVRPGTVMVADSMVVPCFHIQAPWAPSIQSPQEK